jgi:hypothetical protein
VGASGGAGALLTGYGSTHPDDSFAPVARGGEAELYLQHGRGHFLSFLPRGSAIEAGIDFMTRQVLPAEAPSAPSTPP